MDRGGGLLENSLPITPGHPGHSLGCRTPESFPKELDGFHGVLRVDTPITLLACGGGGSTLTVIRPGCQAVTAARAGLGGGICLSGAGVTD